MAKARIRKLTEREVQFKIYADHDDAPIRGHFATDEPELDRKLEDELMERVNSGDVWAWASVRVVATWSQFQADDMLGCCSYEDEDDFKAGGYFEDMKANALAELNAIIATRFSDIERLLFNPRGKVIKRTGAQRVAPLRNGFELHEESGHYVRKGYTLVKCHGEAHSNAHIDHCMVCLNDTWGWLVEKLP